MRFFVFLLCLSVSLSDPLDDEWDMSMWGIGDSIWESVPLAENGNFTRGNATGDYAAIWPSQNVTLRQEAPSIIDLAFRQEEIDMFNRLNTLLDNLFGVQNATVDGPWTFVSVVTLMPLRCADVDKVVALFNEALQKSNPDSDMSSTAQKLGAEPCNGGVCPCTQHRRVALSTLIPKVCIGVHSSQKVCSCSSGCTLFGGCTLLVHTFGLTSKTFCELFLASWALNAHFFREGAHFLHTFSESRPHFS